MPSLLYKKLSNFKGNFSKPITLVDIIPLVTKRLIECGEKAPFGNLYIAEAPTYNLISWPRKPDAMSEILSDYGEQSNLEKIFRLEDITKQYHAEVNAIQEVLVEKLGADTHRRRGAAIIAWQNIALPTRVVDSNVIRIFPPGELYGHPIYDVMSCEDFIQWINHHLVDDAIIQRKNKKIIAGLAAIALIFIAVSGWLFIKH
jgi:hypothetical protein